MLCVVGMGDVDWDKFQIGIVFSWNEIMFCNLSLDWFVQGVKEGVYLGGGYLLQFGMIFVLDGILMGYEGMYFLLVLCEVIVDLVEIVMMVECFDGLVLFVGCDKFIFGMFMVSVCFDLLSVFFYVGLIVFGWVKFFDGIEKDVMIIDLFEVVGVCCVGFMSEEDFKCIECVIVLGEGVCGGMYMVNMMVLVVEVFGLSFFGLVVLFVVDCCCDYFVYCLGEVVVNFLCQGIMMCDIFILEVFENVIVLVMVFGGFMNVVFYLFVIVCEVEVELNFYDFNCIGDKVLYVVDMKFFGKYVMNDVDCYGGIFVIMKVMFDEGLLYGDVFIVIGKIFVENFVEFDLQFIDGEVIYMFDNLIYVIGGLMILYGLFVFEGVVVKIVGFDVVVFEGFVCVFEWECVVMDVVVEGMIEFGIVIVICYEGFKGGLGMCEMLVIIVVIKGVGFGKDVLFLMDG